MEVSVGETILHRSHLKRYTMYCWLTIFGFGSLVFNMLLIFRLANTVVDAPLFCCPRILVVSLYCWKQLHSLCSKIAMNIEMDSTYTKLFTYQAQRKQKYVYSSVYIYIQTSKYCNSDFALIMMEVNTSKRQTTLVLIFPQ